MNKNEAFSRVLIDAQLAVLGWNVQDANSTGDMLFSLANTEERIGANAIVEAANGTSLLPEKLWRSVWVEQVAPMQQFELFHKRRCSISSCLSRLLNDRRCIQMWL